MPENNSELRNHAEARFSGPIEEQLKAETNVRERESEL